MLKRVSVVFIESSDITGRLDLLAIYLCDLGHERYHSNRR
jgi:hypothetical protein